jgi:hypothetical protein
MTVALAGTSEGHAFTDRLVVLWHRGAFIAGPLWFVQALLIFSVGALFWYLLFRTDQAASSIEDRDRPFPSNRTLAVAAVATGVVALVLRLKWPVGSEAFGLQLGYFASYVVLYAAGCMASRYRWLERIPVASVRIWRRVALVTLPILPAAYFLGAIVPGLPGQTSGGLNPMSVLYAFWEPLIAWGGAAGQIPATLCGTR